MKKPPMVKVAAHTRKPPSPPAVKPFGGPASLGVGGPVVPALDAINPQMGTVPNIPVPKLANIIRGGAAAIQGAPPMPKPVIVAQKVPKMRFKKP